LAARESEDEEGKGPSAETREILYINIELYIDTHEINYIDKIRYDRIRYDKIRWIDR
jgi:hypothetical protein